MRHAYEMPDGRRISGRAFAVFCWNAAVRWRQVGDRGTAVRDCLDRARKVRQSYNFRKLP